MRVPIACNLTAIDADAQIGEWRRLADDPEVTVERVSPGKLVLRLGPLVDVAAVVDLAQREKGCCPFFGFTLEIDSGSLALRITAPDDAAAVLDALAG